MSSWADCYEVDDDVIVLRVHVHPGAGRTAVAGRHGDAVKLRVAAPPLDDRANRAVLALIVEVTGLGADAVELAGGERSRAKRIRLRGITAEVLDRALEQAVERGAGPKAGRR